MKRYFLLVAVVALAAFSCQKEPIELTGDPVPLTLAAEVADAIEADGLTRADYNNGSKFSAWVTDASGEEKQVDYTYDGTAWAVSEDSPALTVDPQAGTVAIRAWGSFATAAGTAPARFSGEAAYTIQDGRAVASIVFAPSSAIVRFTITDLLGGGELAGAHFTVSSDVLRRTTGGWAGLPDAPALGAAAFTGRSAGSLTQVRGATVAGGTELFTLTCTTAAGSIATGDTFTVKAPASGLTISGGRSYRITIELGNGREAVITDVTVSDFEAGGPINIGVKGICTKADFLQFAADYNADATAALTMWGDNGTVNLWNDIDLGEETVRIISFEHHFNGNGHTLSNLKNTSGALFSIIESAGVVENLYVQGETIGGGIARSNIGAISNCSFTGTVTGNGDIGGIAGDGSGKIIGSTFSGTVTATASAGGIAGWYTGTVVGCRVLENSSITTTATGSHHGAGAIVGCLQGATAEVTGCYSLDATISSSGAPTGGIVGNNGGNGIAGLVAYSFWLSGGQTYAIGYDKGRSDPFTPTDCGSFANKAGFTDQMVTNMNTALSAAGVTDYEWQRPSAGEYPEMVEK